MRVRDEAKEILIRKKAAELIVSNGLDGFSMKTLAINCSISVSTIYVYYTSKAALFFQLILHLRIEQLNDSIQGLKENMSFEDGLHLQWKNRIDYYLAHPVNIQVLERLKYTKQFQETTSSLIEYTQPVLRTFIENSIRRGELAKMTFELYWSIGIAPLYALIEFNSAGKSYGSNKFALSAALIEEGAKRAAMALQVMG